ncbi:hypothetical protein K2173_015766 [Erythroxylum novogranatense]|uniref:S-adenosylmethionine-dependent methyltransferase n=1 Tax=Erythroxylum novogranatense TaxID=1862640 RepID=A0AAV8SEI6_9ROSI|nr:hypothetical protein K2173_015766 [Erythroxylum novogranatense]
MKDMATTTVATNGGKGNYSYANNSYYQKLAADLVNDSINEVIMEKLDVKSLSSTSNTICISDFGCAVGPNTCFAMQNMVDTIEKKFHIQSPDSSVPKFFVFFNDMVSNDFNTLFTSLPVERSYFAAGVPGSFHGRLFPNCSLQFAYSSIALHWLSTIPEELLDHNSPAWNKGRIHYSGAPDCVLNAYACQFARDMENFLDSRAKEIVVGGMMAIIMPGFPLGMPFSRSSAGLMYDCMATIFMEMAQEGLIGEDQVHNFNLPIYSASPEEIERAVEKNGCFSIEMNELRNPTSSLQGPISAFISEWTLHVRAAFEGMFIKHFKSEAVNDMFDRLIVKLTEISDQLDSSYVEKIQLLVVLKRK